MSRRDRNRSPFTAADLWWRNFLYAWWTIALYQRNRHWFPVGKETPLLACPLCHVLTKPTVPPSCWNCKR